MSPLPAPRRTTRVLYQGHGILVARIQDEQRLWHGMKDHAAVVIPERGAWEFLYCGATYRQAPGTLQLKQPGEIYRDLRRDSPTTYDTIIFDPAVLAAARRASATGEVMFNDPQLAITDARAPALLAVRDAATLRDPLAIDSAVAEAALTLVALGAATSTPRGPGREAHRIQRTKAYLRDRLAEPIRLDDVADHVGLDKHHLIRAFRAQVGVPPYAYLLHARVHRARQLLRAGLTAGAAATAVGFCDQSQLHRHFVRLTGMTPGRYAARARAARPQVALGVEYGLAPA